MANTIPSLNRREFLLASLGGLSLASLPAEKKTVAAIVTEYRYRSHADVICGRILEGYTPNNMRVQPRTRIVSMYTDQIAEKDMSQDLAAKHDFKIYPTVEEALTLGGEKLGVDAVLLIGEHGKYPTNEMGQKLYPRYELFQQIIQIFQKSGRSVPLFSDKHLSYSWPKAREMYRQARELGFPFMAGSSIPVTVRTPELELPFDCKLENALSIGYGDLDAYGFHTLETLQCMVERRAGGETGLAAVETREGEAVWNWRDSPDGKWSKPLLEAALARSARKKAGPPEQNARKPALFLLEYRDGFRAASFMLDGHTSDFLFAAKLNDRVEPASCLFALPSGRDLPHFDGLVHCIEEMFVTGRAVYPVERTVLTTGALAFLFESRDRRRRLETPELTIAYRPPRQAYFQRA
jgi:hypothetical protein